jgi:hypothetical protein
MTLARMAGALVIIGLAFLLLPDTAFAWTPGTHIWLGETILANLRLLPPHAADLLHAFPYDFLYGSIAPDISLAKKYVPPGRHSHYWTVGQEVLHHAPTDALRAFGLGYLSHLAADTVAHNFFVPRQLLLTSSTRTMGHTYWEIRAETHLTDAYSRRAKEIIQLDHAQADRHLERIISPTIFSVPTNRRIFRGMVHLAHTRSWQRAMQAARERSRWLLTDEALERFLACAYDSTMEALADERAFARTLDPSGHLPLAQAKRMRRREMLKGAWYEPERLVTAAEARFAPPSQLPGYWSSSAKRRPWLEGALALLPSVGSGVEPGILTPDLGS